MNISLSAFAPENLISRDGCGNPVPRQLAHLHTQAESGAYLQDISRVPRRRYPFIYFKPPYSIGPVPSLPGHVIVYRWRSLPRVRRHSASKPQGSSSRTSAALASPWANKYAPLFLTPTIGMKWACRNYRFWPHDRRTLKMILCTLCVDAVHLVELCLVPNCLLHLR